MTPRLRWMGRWVRWSIPGPVRRLAAWAGLLVALPVLLLRAEVPAVAPSAPAGTVVPGLVARSWTSSPAPGAKTTVGFTRLDGLRTGIAFTNRLEGDAFLTNAVANNGSGVAVGDVDGDGRPDIYLCALQGPNRLFLNRGDLRFEERAIGAAACPDQLSTGAVLADVDGDGDVDLLVNGIAAGTRFFRNDGRGGFTEGTDSGLSRSATPMSMALADIDGDGDLDAFVAGRGVPGRFPEPASSVCLRNDRGTWVRADAWSAPFRDLGRVSGAVFFDADDDGDPDLAVALEWGAIRCWLNQGGRFEEVSTAWGLAAEAGLWNCLAAGDLDGDGRMDLVAGNAGRNTEYELVQPARLALVHGPWLGEGTQQAFETWERGGVWRPFRDRNWLTTIFPDLPQRFPTHRAFGEATEASLLEGRPGRRRRLEVSVLESSVFLNRGGRFERRPLPREAQESPVFAIAVADLDGDGHEDLVLGQNRTGRLSALSRDDNGRGLWLRGEGAGRFRAALPDAAGFAVEGDQRGVAVLDADHDGRWDVAISENQGPTRLYRNTGGRPGLRVLLAGPPANPAGIGAWVRLRHADGTRGPARMVLAGSGSGGQDGWHTVLATPRPATVLEVRWPGGRRQEVPLEPGVAEVRVQAP